MSLVEGGTLPCHEIHAACHISIPVLQQPDDIPRAEEDIVHKHQAIRWPCWHAEIRHLQKQSLNQGHSRR